MNISRIEEIQNEFGTTGQHLLYGLTDDEISIVEKSM